MHAETKQRWEELCVLAAKEQDPVRLLKLVREINKLLDEKENSFGEQSKPIHP